MKSFKQFIKESHNKSIAVDLDGTLAHHTKYEKGVIGKPIIPMLNRVKKWIKAGKLVKIFTARAGDKTDVNAIKAWFKENDLPELEITNKKTPDMEVFYDDRAIQVKKNSGELVEEGFGNVAKYVGAAAMLGLGALTTPVEGKPTNNVPITQVLSNVDLTALRTAIGKTETLGQKNRDKAVGDKGKAFGRYQIHPEVVIDVNNYYKTSYKHSDMFDPIKAADVFNKYMTIQAKRYYKRTGKAPNYEVLARMWNGGPMGYKNVNTTNYWAKTKNYLNSPN